MKRLAISILLLTLFAACSVEDEQAKSGDLSGSDADFIVGELDIYPSMEGEGLLPRDIIVWTPPGYEEDTDRVYPVVYMHDGQNLFDPRTSYIGVEWGIDESVDRLVREGRIEPIIVVGLANTENRTEDYSPGPRGEAYMDFLVNKVKPMVDEKYRTRPGKQHTLTGGSSMGGLISCMLGWRHPDVFGAVMCYSPAFRVEGYEDWSLFFTGSGGEKRDVFFYVYNGGVGLEQKLQPGIDYMLDFWKKSGYRWGEDFVFVKDPEAEHTEQAWAEWFPEALERSLEGASHR
jgi:predicted alpha/beta superfamily hydrolase